MRASLSFLRRHEWGLLAILGLVALVLGFIGFMKVGGTRSGWDAFYRDLQLLVLEGGHLEGEPVPWELEVARLLLPLVAAYAGLKGLAAIFREQIGPLRLRLIPARVVVCGLGERGAIIAKAQRAQGERVVVIEKDGSSELIGPCRRTGAVVLVGDATDPEVLRAAQVHRARHVVSVCGDDRANAEVAVQVRALARTRASGALSCVVHIIDPQLCTLLKSYEICEHHEEGFRLDCFNVYESGANAVLKEHPPFDAWKESHEQPHLAIIGLGRLGQSLLVQAARRWVTERQTLKEPLRVTVIDRQAKSRIAALVARFPQLGRACHLTPRELDVESSEFDRADLLVDPQEGCDFTRIYVCLGEESLATTAALKLRQHLGERRIPIVVRLARSTGLASLLKAERRAPDGFEVLRAFGFLDETCDAEVLLGGTYEVLARATHEEYVREQEQQGQTPETNPALVPWNDLPETLKESNRDQAAHIGVKLRAIGCGIVPWSDWAAESFEFTHDETELLSRMEHDRWVAERLRAGWKYTSGGKNHDKKETPYLVPWEELSEEVKGWDRVAVRGMPSFLAKAGFQIVRLGVSGPDCANGRGSTGEEGA